MQKGAAIQVFYGLRRTAVVVMRNPAEYRMILKIMILFKNSQHHGELFQIPLPSI